MARAGMLLLLLFSAPGCVDSGARFDQFTARKEAQRQRELDAGGASVLDGGCTMPSEQQLAGEYLFAMAAKPAPDRPILARLTIKPRTEGDTLVGTVLFEPLATEDGMSTVGVKNEGTFELSGGALETPAFHVVLPGDANPVQQGLNAEADIIFSSTVCLDGDMAVQVFCGDAAGNITLPLSLPLDGSTFAATRIEPGKPWPAVVASCAQLAAQ